MSDIDPELPDYLVEAILSQDPPAEAVDLVKNAFSWRTIDAELMELSYDSVLDVAGVRDASARRTLEFTMGNVSVVVEVDGQRLTGQLTGWAATSVEVRSLEARQSVPVADNGSFIFETTTARTAMLVFSNDAGSLQTPVFQMG